MTIAALIDLFLLTRSQGAAATVKFYRGRLKLFRAKYGDRELASLTLGEITACLIEGGQGKSDSTRRHNAVALTALQTFALDGGLLDKPWFRKLDKPAMGRRDRLPTDDETARLLARASPQFRAMYQALRQSGARPGELCRATIADWDKTAGAIVLKQHKTARKTGKPRVIPVGKILRAMLVRAVGRRTSGPLFLSPTGQGWTPDNLGRTYTRLRQAAGLPQGLVLYLARHEAGTRLCKTAGVEQAARVLGHSSTQITSRYVHLDTGYLADMQDRVK
jgi:integrase